MDLKQAQEKLTSLEGRLKALEDRTAKPVVWPKAYVLDFAWQDPGNFVAAPVVDALPEQTKTQVIAAGTTFLVREIVTAYAMQGTLVSGAAPVVYTMHPNKYRAMQTTSPGFTFDYRLYDTGSGREWDNDWMPGWVLRSGSRNGCVFGRGRGILAAGAELTMRVRATRALPMLAPTVLDDTTITGHRLQVVFFGSEVRT